MKSAIFLTLVLALLVPYTLAWGSNKDRVRLEDVKAITLHQGQMTNGRRSSPVPQLKCVGGTAGCHGFQPKVVQCVNTGFDGYDVQWECKTDMDSAYRFGKIQVSCEGYDYPDDPYVLRGSCGLEYELDLTEEGYNQRSHGGGHYRDDYYHHSPPVHHYNHGWGGFSFRKLISYVILGCVIYWALKCCCAGPRRYATSSYSSASSTYSGTHASGTGMPGSGSGPGFWTGAATGGMLGYLFGNRGNGGWGSSWGGYGPSYSRRPYSGGWGSGWSSGGGWGGGSSFSSGSRRSSGSSSRTTSGFGGTSRR